MVFLVRFGVTGLHIRCSVNCPGRNCSPPLLKFSEPESTYLTISVCPIKFEICHSLPSVFSNVRQNSVTTSLLCLTKNVFLQFYLFSIAILFIPFTSTEMALGDKKEVLLKREKFKSMFFNGNDTKKVNTTQSKSHQNLIKSLIVLCPSSFSSTINQNTQRSFKH